MRLGGLQHRAATKKALCTGAVGSAGRLPGGRMMMRMVSYHIGNAGEGGVWGSAGFSVEGVVKEDQLLRKGGMSPGQAIILTKPLGTGVLLAAAMRGATRGRWITGARSSCGFSAAACWVAASCLLHYFNLLFLPLCTILR